MSYTAEHAAWHEEVCIFYFSIFRKFSFHSNSNSNSRICSAPPTVSPKVHYIVSTRCEKENTLDCSWMLLSTTAWVSVLSLGDSMHEVRRQRMHGHQFAVRFLFGRGCGCWRRAVKSVMKCWWPAWAGWWCSPAPGQSGPCARGDTVCSRFVARQEASVTPVGREIHGRVVSGRARVSPPRAGLSAVVPVSPPGGRRGRRCSSRGATALGPRPVAQKRRGRVVDEQSVDGAGEKTCLSNTR